MHGGASREENSRMRLKTMLLAAAVAMALAQPATALLPDPPLARAQSRLRCNSWKLSAN
jgi:Na+/H+ antiporter NhaD/arsenite permease-like protein